MVEQFLKDSIDRFNKKAAEDPKLAKELAGIKRTVMIEVTDGDSYNFVLDNARADGLAKGKIDSPDIKVSASTETFKQLQSGELRVMKAYAMRKIQVKAPLEDVLRLRKFF
ncbi:MAG: SCP2 sterol-binding domain-containing protein [Candidatus Thermoplasmatota archaeon]|nr:SCP2 sterol-binding domain-containing protein [Candidatus Thermoplasmatota archaeon]